MLNSLIGIAVAEGKINLSDTLEKLGIDDNKPSLTDVEKQATVRDLLEARSGVYHPTDYETKGMIEKKPQRGSHAPGTFWYDNNWDFNTLGYIYEHATGTKIFQSFYREIAQPIGMQDFRPHDGHYITSADSLFPAYPFDMSTRDFARFALLYLHGGNWNGTQVVPEDWLRLLVVDGRLGQRRTTINSISQRKLLGRGPSWTICRRCNLSRPDHRQPPRREPDQRQNQQTPNGSAGANGGFRRTNRVRLRFRT